MERKNYFLLYKIKMPKEPKPTGGQTRNWCWTLNNPKPEDFERLNQYHAENKNVYTIYGVEQGQEGTPHLQGYTHMSRAQRMSAMKKMVPRGHIEMCKGTPEQNIAYCCKEDKDPMVYGAGNVPQSQQKTNKENAKRLLRLAEAGDFDSIKEEFPSQYIARYRTLHQIATDNMTAPPDLEQPCGLWIYGESGSGKTHMARNDYGTYYSKNCNKWWDGYLDQDTVIIEDMDPNHAKLAHHIKLWTDKWSFTAEIKGGTRSLRPKLVIITSQYSIDEVFREEGTEAIAAIKRRCKIIHKHIELNQSK